MLTIQLIPSLSLIFSISLSLSICGTHAARRRRPRNAQGIKLIVGISQGGLGELRLCCPSLFLVVVADAVVVVVYI